MQGKTVVITGATSGIGEAAAVRLAGLGARLVIVGRDRARTDAVLAKLRAANPGAAHTAHLADLSRLSEMKRVAAEIAAAERSIDVLVNNAGAIRLKREITEDGLERTFALNHMAYFVVTNALLDRLKTTASARIIATSSSSALHGLRIDFDELTATRWVGARYNSMQAYGRSKLFNMLWTQTLSRGLEGSGVTANCFHPGVVRSRIWNGPGADSPGIKRIIGLMSPAFRSPESGADTPVWLASSSSVEGRSGGYYVRRKLVPLGRAARDEAWGERLWAESARIAAAA